jgi:hypothetical protein
LAAINLREVELLNTSVARILGVAIVIDTNTAVLREAMTLRARIGLSSQDAVVFAAVMNHLQRSVDPGPHYFANRN